MNEACRNAPHATKGPYASLVEYAIYLNDEKNAGRGRGCAIIVRIDGIKRLTVLATDLHGFVQISRHLATWIKGKINKCGFVEGIDCSVFDSPDQGNQTGRGIDHGVFPKTGKPRKVVVRPLNTSSAVCVLLP